MKDCVDCATTIVEGDLGEFVACLGTVITGIVIRFIEKRRLKKKLTK